MTAQPPVSGWTPVPTPYYRPDHLERNLIPSPQAIRESTEILSERSAERVVAVSNTVVRYGTATKEREGQALLYLEHHLPNLPAPKLLAMFRDDGQVFIVMEKIRGQRLDILWPSLQDAEKARIICSLEATTTRMRTLRGPFFGSVDGTCLSHHLFYVPGLHPTRSGPFASEEDLNGGLLLHYQDIQEMNRRRPYKSRFYSETFAQALKGHSPVFSHSDIQRKNIIIAEPDADGDEPREPVAFLVDWEDAGWYPEYWEYFAIFKSCTWDDDWCERAHDFIQCWPSEAAIMKMVYTDLVM